MLNLLRFRWLSIAIGATRETFDRYLARMTMRTTTFGRKAQPGHVRSWPEAVVG